MDILEKPKGFYLSTIWALGSITSLLISVGSIGIVFTRMQDASRQIPNILVAEKAVALDVAVLQDQQRNLDSKYAEIMIQLSRLDAKLDKQNDYLFESLQRIDRKQKNSYKPADSIISGILEEVSTSGIRNPSPSQ